MFPLINVEWLSSSVTYDTCGIRRMVQVGEGVMATSGGPTVLDATIMLGGLGFHYRELTGRDPDSGPSALI